MQESLYIHIPFCRRKCIYCDFYSIMYEDTLAAAYVDVLVSQIGRLQSSPSGFSTIYIGGGTPTVLRTTLLEKLLAVLGPSPIEFTCEANPESLDDAKLRMLLAGGVNRLSIGMQSLDGRKLKRIGRVHDAEMAKNAVLKARKAGFANISADLIFGVWGETLEDWKGDLEDIAALPLTHVSCYELTYEKNTPLFKALENKSVAPLAEEALVAMYGEAIARLSVRGFKQYEVSNFAKPGRECKHNLKYWNNDPYIGLGPGAFSYDGETRSRNVADVREYIRLVEEGKSPADFSEKLPPARRARETAAVKIRTREGIDFKWFKDKTGFDFLELEKKALKPLIDQELIKYKKEGHAVTGVALRPKGFLFCDTISSALL